MKKEILLAIIVVAAVSGCVSRSGFTGTTITGNEIVFASDKYSTNNELYLMNDDGSDVRRLTYNDYEDNDPAFSPDKERIAFHRATDPADYSTYEIYVMDLATGAETRITDDGYLDVHPSWSPGGDRLVFARYDKASEADLYTIDLTTGAETRLTDTPWDESDPEWSPDGTKIAFKSDQHTNESGKDEIYVMNAEGSNERRLTTVTGWESDHDPSWSSDGSYVYFERYEGNVSWIQEPYYFQTHWQEMTPWNIYAVSLSGSEERVTDCSYMCWLPVQYHDMIMFLNDDFVIYNGTLLTIQVEYATIFPDGSNETALLPSDEYEYNKAYYDF